MPLMVWWKSSNRWDQKRQRTKPKHQHLRAVRAAQREATRRRAMMATEQAHQKTLRRLQAAAPGRAPKKCSAPRRRAGLLRSRRKDKRTKLLRQP